MDIINESAATENDLSSCLIKVLMILIGAGLLLLFLCGVFVGIEIAGGYWHICARRHPEQLRVAPSLPLALAPTQRAKQGYASRRKSWISRTIKIGVLTPDKIQAVLWCWSFSCSCSCSHRIQAIQASKARIKHRQHQSTILLVNQPGSFELPGWFITHKAKKFG